MFCLLLQNVPMTHIAQKWGPKCMLSAEMESAKVTLISKVMILKYIDYKITNRIVLNQYIQTFQNALTNSMGIVYPF